MVTNRKPLTADIAAAVTLTAAAAISEMAKTKILPFLRDVFLFASLVISAKSTSSALTSSSASSSTAAASGSEECGQRGPSSRIIGGERAALGEFPWQISLRVSWDKPP